MVRTFAEIFEVQENAGCQDDDDLFLRNLTASGTLIMKN